MFHKEMFHKEMFQSDNHQISITKKSSFTEKLHDKIDVNELRNKRKSFMNADELFDDDDELFDDDECFKSLEKLMILPPPPPILGGYPNPRTGFRSEQTYTSVLTSSPSPSSSQPPPISVKHNTPQPPLNKQELNRKKFIRNYRKIV